MSAPENTCFESLQTAFDDILRDLALDQLPSPSSPISIKAVEEGEFYVSEGRSQPTKRWVTLYNQHLEISVSFKDKRLLHSIMLSESILLSGFDNLLKHGLVLDTGMTTLVLKSARPLQLNNFFGHLQTLCTLTKPMIKTARSSSSPSIRPIQIQRFRSNSVNEIALTPIRPIPLKPHTKPSKYHRFSSFKCQQSFALPPLVEEVKTDESVKEVHGIDESYGTMSSRGSRYSKLSSRGSRCSNLSSRGSRYSNLPPNGSRDSNLSSRGPRNSNLSSRGPRNSNLPPNGSRYSNLPPNGSRLSYLGGMLNKLAKE